MLGLSFVLLWIAQAPSLSFDAPPELAAAKSQLESVTRLEEISPDGKLLAFFSDESERMEVWVTPFRADE